MKALLFRVPTVDDRSFRVQVDEGAHFYERLHFHPEFQLTLILEGTGTLVVGDRIDRFQPLDLLLLGADVPHVLLSDPAYFERNEELQIKACTFFLEKNSSCSFLRKRQNYGTFTPYCKTQNAGCGCGLGNLLM